MSKEMDDMDDVDNVGIMQGFLDRTTEEENDEDEEYSSDEASAARMLNRRPDSPEILMNNLRGDMRSIDARREELADLVGYEAATETPESVLAMLQPVLAQQAGIGALPQSQAMAQGPQPPMPPPPGGMGSPPSGSPLPPPGGAPSPVPGDNAAALMASAGLPPGGGPAPEMIGPDGQPIPPEGMPPIAMRDGGLVQRFRDGSDEEGVTPANPMGGNINPLYSPEMVQAAEQNTMSMLMQQPQAVPTLEEATASRLPEYERLLAPDRNMAQANMLFNIAGAALNYASNRDAQGQVMRGSPLSRLAGAFSGVPAAIQQQVAEIEKGKQQLRLLALQAGEKDRSRIMEMNQDLETTKRNLLSSVFRSSNVNRNPASQFRGNWEMLAFNTPGLMDRYAAGETTPEEDRYVESATTSYTEPRYEAIIDPDSKMPTGQFRTIPGRRLPTFVTRAMAARGSAPSATAATAPVTTAPAAAPSVPVVEERAEEELPPVPAPLLDSGGREPTQLGQAVPSARPEGEPTYLPREEAMREKPNLWRDAPLIAGPVASVMGFVTNIPGLGDPMAQVTMARSQADLIAKDVLQLFTKSAQNSITEQNMVRAIVKIQPAFFRDPEAYRTHLVALDSIFDSFLKENEQMMVSGNLTPAQRTDARAKSMQVERFRSYLNLPPKVYTMEEYMSLPVGTEILWKGYRPGWVGREQPK
jgi:hypothetical protein